MGLIGISSAALVLYMQGFREQTTTVERENVVSFNVHSKILSNLQALLVETRIDNNGQEQEQSTWGICSFLNPPHKTSGVEPLLFNIGTNLTNRTKGSFSETRWKNFFDKSEYEISVSDAPCRKIDSSFQSSYFERCFKYLGEQSETANEIYIIARIVPKDFLKSSPIKLTVANALDPKEVFFELQSHVAIFKGSSENNSGDILSSKRYEIIWSNSVTECHVQSTSNQWVIVQFSGTGTGRISRNVVINSSVFSDPNVCSDLVFNDIAPHTIMSYKILNNGNVVADLSQNIRAACRRKVYKCPGTLANKDEHYDPIAFNVGMANESGGVLNIKKIRMNLVKASLATSKGGSQISSLKVEASDLVKNFETNKDLTDVQLDPGHSILRLTIDKKTDGSLMNFCNNICTGENKFPLITINLKKPAGATCTSYSSEYSDDKYRLRCVACHSKICSKDGLGAFGPIQDEGNVQGLIDEPLDGAIPECALPLETDTEKYELPQVSGGSGECVAMQVSGISSFKNFETATYEFHPCSADLPVLCFAHGHYLPAISVSSLSGPVLFKGSFDKAQTACYEMGREIIKKEHLGKYFKATYSDVVEDAITSIVGVLNLPVFGLDADYFDYVNNASRGIFLVPKYNIKKLSRWLTAGSSSYFNKFGTGYNKIWVAIEKDAGDQKIGSIPQAVTADSSFAVFNRQQEDVSSRPVLLKNSDSISNSGTKVVLTHNIQYKGVVAVNGGNYPVLCRKDYGDFALVTGGHTLEQAVNACKNKGGGFHFLPPVSSLEWIKAMTLINKNSEMYPFPDPGDLSGDNYIHNKSIPAPKAWVALSKRDTGTSAKNYRLSEAYFPDKNGKESIFKTDEIPEPGKNPDKYIGIIDETGIPVVPAPGLTAVHFGNKYTNKFDYNNYKTACFKDEGFGQVEVKDSVTATDGSQSCGSNLVSINTEDQLKIKSIRFMTGWVTKNNATENFIIGRQKLKQVILRANNVLCKKQTCSQCVKKNTCPRCKSGCQSAASSCISSCPTITETETDDVCVANCQNPGTCGCTTTTSKPDPSCVDDCDTIKNNCIGNCLTCNGVKYSNCNAKCNCEYNTAGLPQWANDLF